MSRAGAKRARRNATNRAKNLVGNVYIDRKTKQPVRITSFKVKGVNGGSCYKAYFTIEGIRTGKAGYYGATYERDLTLGTIKRRLDNSKAALVLYGLDKLSANLSITDNKTYGSCSRPWILE